jgi:hypothetical protein
MDHALGYVQSAFGPSPAPTGPGPSDDSEDVVVLVSRRRAPLWRVVQEIEATLGREPGQG